MAPATLKRLLHWFPPDGEMIAEVAQLVERNLAKVEVAGSNPVFRSRATWPSG